MSRNTSKLVENLRTLHLQIGAHGLLGALEISSHENDQQNGNSSKNKAREISNNVAALPIDLVGEVSKDISKYKVVSNKCKVFVGNIGFKVRARELKDFFGYFGDVVYAQIIMDRVKKRSKGFGFVTFSNRFEAERAINSSDEERTLDGRVMFIDQPTRKRKGGQHSNSDVLLQDAVKQFEKTEEKCVTVNNLNDDMLLYIFSFLGMKDRVIIERVCRRWRTLAAKSWNSVRHLQFNHIFCLRNGGLTDDIFLGVLRRGTASLVSLDLSASASLLTDFAVHCIARHCRNLKFVDLTGVEVSTSSLKSLSQKCTLLETIKIRRCYKAGEKGFWWLFKQCQCLKHVDISESKRITGQCFFMLPASMESLNLRECARITDVGLKYVGMRCQNLKIINISECFSLTDAGFLELTQNCSNIEALTFVQPPKTVTIHGLRSIENLKRLRELNISQCAAVSDEFLFALGQSCICLTSLNIEACGPAITDAGLQSLAPCFQLKKLVISYLDEVTHDFINHLGQNINLQTFIVRACPGFTDEGVKCTLRFFKDLEHLDLSGCLNITDMCTEHIMTYYGSVTTTRPRLTIVLGGTQVTEECAHALQTRCHGCKILMDDLSNEMLRTDRDPYFGMRDFYPEFDEEDDDDDENEFEGDMANGDDHFYEDFLEAEDPALLNDYENWS
ncbi:F-box/LRR-repeat protein 2-like [Nematostella vectensis]|uniref:F-box/LRR-repeat protein 2-like n=1 Tax=Nematostella vectensis TaxID=45351 RepID=UPI00207775AF|nr:F-box/LRR-repeat protein 2-like [Nematostella vectensis]